MAELKSAVAALRLVGTIFHPDEVTTLVGLPPTRSFSRSEEIHRERSPTRVAKFGLWTLEARETQPADIDAQVSELLRPLTPDLGIWRALAERFRMDLFCGWFMEFGNEGLAIAPWTLRALAERHISLDLDIFAGDNDLTPG